MSAFAKARLYVSLFSTCAKLVAWTLSSSNSDGALGNGNELNSKKLASWPPARLLSGTPFLKAALLARKRVDLPQGGRSTDIVGLTWQRASYAAVRSS